MRLSFSLFAAIIVTLALFYIMQSLIGGEVRKIEKPTGYGVVDFVRLQRDVDESPFVQRSPVLPSKPSPSPDLATLSELQWSEAKPPPVPRERPINQPTESMQLGHPFLGPPPVIAAKSVAAVKTQPRSRVEIPSSVPVNQPKEIQQTRPAHIDPGGQPVSKTASEDPSLQLARISPGAETGMASGLIGLELEQGGDAIPVYRIEPKYPRKAARSRIEGWVKVEFTITAKGTVTDAVVIDSRPRRTFDRSALQSIRKWRFKPKQVNGQAVERKASQVIEFKLAKG